MPFPTTEWRVLLACFYWHAGSLCLLGHLSPFYPRDLSCPLWVEVYSPSSSKSAVSLFWIKIYACFSSNESHPCHPHKILHLRPSPRGNSKCAKCLSAPDTRAPERLQRALAPAGVPMVTPSDPSCAPCCQHSPLYFSTVHVLHWGCRCWPLLHLESFHSSFKKDSCHPRN